MSAHLMHRIAPTVALALAGVCVLLMVASDKFALALACACLAALAGTATGVVATLRGVRLARFHLAAWTGLLCGLLFKSAEVAGWVPATFITAYAWQVGALLSLVWFSLALADNISQGERFKAGASSEAMLARTQSITALSRYQRIVENVLEGIFETTREGQVVSANAAMAAMLGYDDPEHMKRVVGNLREQHLADENDRRRVFSALHEQGQFKALDLRLRRLDGSEFWASASMRSITHGVTDGAAFDGIVQDVSERREKQELERERAMAQAATAAKSEFLAKMSHELRTPMNAVIGFTDLALRTDSDARRREHLEHIESASHNLLNIINDILDLSRVEAGKLVLQSSEFELEQSLEKVTRLIAPTAGKKNLELTLCIAPDVPTRLIGDPLRLEQVLTNLMNNAVKFTERGEINLRVGLDAATEHAVDIHFSLRDTGIGLSDEQRSRLFQPFEQADATTTREYGGSGLGLAICRQLVQLMGGDIAVAPAPGGGSIFHFNVPMGRPQGTATPDEIKSRVSAANDSEDFLFAGQRILLVEDNPLNQRLACEILGDAGLRVEIAENGRRALELLAQNPFDLVLMDLQMPVMDGLAASRAIREQEQFAHLPIIAMTANAMQSDRDACNNAGMSDFLSKPMDAALLLQKLKYWLANKQRVATH